MDKAFIEAAIKRAEACQSSTGRAYVLVNLKALLALVTNDPDPKKTKAQTYTRLVDIETDLASIETHSN